MKLEMELRAESETLENNDNIKGESKREIGIDVLKGLGIIFVLLGHMVGIGFYEDISVYIYSFHMPLFFFISGYLKYKKSSNLSVFQNIKKAAKHILLPYFILLTISILFTETVMAYIYTGHIFVVPLDWGEVLQAYFLSGGYLEKIPCQNFPLWYLPLFFIATIIFDLLVRNKKVEKFLPIIVLILIAVTVPFQNLIPGRPALHINVLPAGLAFMGLGYLFNKYIKNEKVPDLLAYVCLAIGILIASVNGGNISEINNVIYYVGAVCSIYFFYAITKDNNNKLLAYIGKNSLIIYGLHALIFSTFAYTFIYRFFRDRFGAGIMLMVVQIIYTLIISIGICKIIDLIKSKLRRRKNKALKSA